MSSYDEKEEQMVILKAKNGDRASYEWLVRKYQRPIYYICRRMTGAHQSADDMSQDTFIKAYAALGKFNNDMNFFSWIRRIAVNNSLNFIKRRSRERPLNPDPQQNYEPPSESESPPQALERKKLEARFHEALSHLPVDQKTVFILRVYENLSYKEIGRLLKIPSGTVMSRLSRARTALKTELKAYI